MRDFVKSAALALASTLLVAVGAGCDDSSRGGLVIVDEPPDAGCIRPAEPASYEVYFAVDVSGSMGPFLTDVRNELVALAGGFPDQDAEGRPVRVDYYFIAFVNDVLVMGGGRMTSIIALQAAFDEAIAAGKTEYNLTRRTFNSEREENVLDALAKVIELAPAAEAKMVLLATDAPFLEAPAVLSENQPVRSSYSTILTELRMLQMRVHAFTSEPFAGINLEFNGQPALISLPGSSVHRLQDLQGARERLRDTLSFIARESACK